MRVMIPSWDDIQSNVKEYAHPSKCWKVSNVQFEQATKLCKN